MNCSNVMADPQFEEFRIAFDNLPQHIKATPQCYQIVHGIDVSVTNDGYNSLNEKDKEISKERCWTESSESISKDSASPIIQRKRRKLPRIPSDREPLSKFRKWPRQLPIPILTQKGISKDICSFSKKSEFNDGELYLEIEASDGQIKPYLRLKSNIESRTLPDPTCSPDENHEHSCHDIDSGHSSLHTPDGTKSFSPAYNENGSSSSTISSLPSASAVQSQDPTHRGLYKFIPRHVDEIDVDIGDPMYVYKEADDFWCEGVNLRTGCNGIFPSAYVTDIDYSDFDPDCLDVKKERYILDFLGSIEVTSHKGNKILLQAVRKIVNCSEFQSKDEIHPCILEISDDGLRMVDKCKNSCNNVPNQDFFFNLKNVTFCGYHPYNHRYFGFVTKHPLKHKFACHIFMGENSTRDIAEAVGRAFQRFYQKFVETMYPVEDIYIE